MEIFFTMSSSSQNIIINLPSRFEPVHLPHLVALCHDALSAKTQSNASRTLEACESVPGFLLALLAILSDKSILNVDAARQVCAACVRNSVRRTWNQTYNTLNALSASSNGTGRSSIVSRRGPQFLPEPIPSQDERTRFKAQLLTLILSTHRAKFL